MTSRGGLRGAIAHRGVGRKTGFRWRGGEITRLEGFTDAVFAFAVTLLVVSLEVPRSFDDLVGMMQGLGAFAVGFTLLFAIWYQQYLFFRRYGLQDLFTITMNGVLLFMVLFFVYPLKFLFTIVLRQLLGLSTDVRLPDGSVGPAVLASQTPVLMMIYGGGYVCIFGLFAILYVHAFRKRAELELNALELLDTRASIQYHILNAFVGLISISIAAIGGERSVGIAGFTYFLLAPLLTLNGTLMGKARKELERQMQSV